VLDPLYHSKAEVRAHLRSVRRRRPAADAALAEALADLVLESAAQSVTAYVPVGAEPGGALLVPALAATGVRLLLPVLRDDLDLDWAEYDGALQPSRRFRLQEPTGPRLGRDAIATVDLIIAPALAVDRAGNRLGQGGGSYDRALARTAAPVIVPLYPGELVDELPAEPHDRPVSAALVAADAGYESPHLYWTKAASMTHHWHSKYQSAKERSTDGG
jgi:5-formyltetrahydrofolate cyclo-ligase